MHIKYQHIVALMFSLIILFFLTVSSYIMKNVALNLISFLALTIGAVVYAVCGVWWVYSEND
jgi:uncharacterized membrane protein YfcA